MWPPMPSDARLARTTIAIAFQRTRLLIRRSTSWLPGSGRLIFGADGVDVRRDRRERQAHACHAGVIAQPHQQPLDAAAVTLLNDVVERLEPLALLECLELGGVAGCDVPHLV